MARSTAEIQAEIAVTRDVIEHRLDDLQRRAPHPLWVVLALVGAGTVVGVLLSRVPILTVLGAGVRTVQAGIGVAAALGAIRRVLAPGRRAGAGDVQRARQLRNRLRRAS